MLGSVAIRQIKGSLETGSDAIFYISSALLFFGRPRAGSSEQRRTARTVSPPRYFSSLTLPRLCSRAFQRSPCLPTRAGTLRNREVVDFDAFFDLAPGSPA